MTDVKEEEPLLLKTVPEQVSSKWEIFAPLLEKSLPPTVTNRRLRMANVLRAILMEELQVWVFVDENQVERYIMSTTIRTDKVSLGKDLLVYSFTSLGQVEPRYVKQGVEVLKKYAKGNGCQSIIAYSADERVTRFFEGLGGSANYKLMQMRV